MCSGESGFYKANPFIYEYESMTDVLMHGSCVGYIYTLHYIISTSVSIQLQHDMC